MQALSECMHETQSWTISHQFGLAIIDGGATAHVIRNDLAKELLDKGLLDRVEYEVTNQSVQWGHGEEPIIGIAYGRGIISPLFLVTNMHCKLLISEGKLCNEGIVIVKNQHTLIGIKHNQLIFYAESEGGESLWLVSIDSLFRAKKPSTSAKQRTDLTTYLHQLLHATTSAIHQAEATILSADSPPLTNPSNVSILSARPTYSSEAVRAARRILLSNRSGDQIASIIEAGAMDHIPAIVKNPALFRRLQVLAGQNISWSLTHLRRQRNGGTGIPCNVPGAVAHIDHIQVTARSTGVVHHLLVIVDECTALVTLYRLLKKLSMLQALKRYRLGIVAAAGWDLQGIRADQESVLSIKFIEEFNDMAADGVPVLDSLAPNVWKNHQRAGGTRLDKSAAEEHEKTAERYIQRIYDDAINSLISQTNLTDNYFPYAAMDAGDKMNGEIGRDGLQSKHEMFWGQRPDFRQYTQGFGWLAICPRPENNRGVGKISRAELVCILASPLSMTNHTSLVLSADDPRKVPRFRAHCKSIPPGLLRRTKAEWDSLRPVVDEKNNILSVKAGTHELFSVEKAVHEYQRKQLQPATSTALTDAQLERYDKMRKENPVNQPPHIPIPIPIPIPNDPPPIQPPIPIQPIFDRDSDKDDEEVEEEKEMDKEEEIGDKDDDEIEEILEDPDEELFATDHQEVGVAVAGEWDGKLYRGQVDGVLLAHTAKDGTRYPNIYSIQYDDGDQEELYGDTALRHAKLMYQRMRPPDDSADLRRSGRIRQRQSVQAASIRLNSSQLMQLLAEGDNDESQNGSPWTEQQQKTPELECWLESEDQFFGYPTGSYDEAGNWRHERVDPASRSANQMVVSYPPPSSTIPTLSNPPPSLSVDEELLALEGGDADPDLYAAIAVWKVVYGVQPTISEIDGIQQLVTYLNRAPSVTEVKQHFDATEEQVSWNQFCQSRPHLRALKAQIRTSKNPSLHMVEHNEELRNNYQPVIATFITDGLQSDQFIFITRQKALDLKAIFLPPIFVFGQKPLPDGLIRYTFRMAPHGGRDPTMLQPHSKFSSVLDAASFKWWLRLLAYWGMELSSSDIVQAFPRLNRLESHHVINKRIVVMEIPAFISGTGQTEIVLLKTITNGLPDASRVLESIKREVLFKAGFGCLGASRNIFLQRVGKSLATVCNYVDDDGKASTNDVIGRGMLLRLQHEEKAAGFDMKYGPMLGPDTPITYLSLTITYNNDAKYGESMHITNEKIVAAMVDTLTNSKFGKKSTPTFVPLLTGWNAMESERQLNAGLIQLGDADFYSTAIGQVNWSMGLVQLSTLASQFASRIHRPSDWDVRALVQFMEYLCSMVHLPLVFAISRHIDNTAPPVIEADVDCGGDVGNMADRSKLAVALYMGEGDVVSGPYRTMSRPVKMSSDTATDELKALEEGNRELALYNTMGLEMSGNHPGLFNSTDHREPRAASMLYTDSPASSMMEGTATAREVVVRLHELHSKLHSDSQTVIDIVQSNGSSSSAKRMRASARSLQIVMYCHFIKLVEVLFKSSAAIRANQLTKLPAGPLEVARNLWMMYGRSQQLDEYVAIVEARYAKHPTVFDPLITPAYHLSVNPSSTITYQPTLHKPFDNNKPCRVPMDASEGPVRTSSVQQHWVNSVNGKVIGLFEKMGYDSHRRALQETTDIPTSSRRLDRDGIGYKGARGNNGKDWVQGSTIEPCEVKAPAPVVLIDYSEQDIDSITHRNTIINSAVDSTATSEHLIHHDMQWVFQAQEADNLHQLQAIKQYQQQLQQAINQKQSPTRKRSADSDHYHLTERQLRVKAEEQRQPSREYFGCISESSERRYCRRYTPQLGSQSKQQCQLSPTFHHHQHQASFNHGTGGACASQAHWSGGDQTGGSHGVAKKNTRGQGAKKRNKAKLFERMSSMN